MPPGAGTRQGPYKPLSCRGVPVVPNVPAAVTGGNLIERQPSCPTTARA